MTKKIVNWTTAK